MRPRCSSSRGAIQVPQLQLQLGLWSRTDEIQSECLGLLIADAGKKLSVQSSEQSIIARQLMTKSSVELEWLRYEWYRSRCRVKEPPRFSSRFSGHTHRSINSTRCRNSYSLCIISCSHRLGPLQVIYNQSQLSERKHVARYWSISAVPVSAHPLR